MTLPTLITLFRILIIPVIIALYYLPYHWSHPLAAVLFAIAAISDWLDGYLARSLGQISNLGSFLDPVADKLLVGMVLIIVVSENHIPFIEIPTAIIIGREITISALREWMAELGKRASVAVTFLAKFKTTVQLVAIVFLLWFHNTTGHWVSWVGEVMLYVAAALTLWSMINYLRLAWPDLTLPREPQ